MLAEISSLRLVLVLPDDIFPEVSAQNTGENLGHVVYKPRGTTILKNDRARLIEVTSERLDARLQYVSDRQHPK